MSNGGMGAVGRWDGPHAIHLYLILLFTLRVCTVKRTSTHFSWYLPSHQADFKPRSACLVGFLVSRNFDFTNFSIFPCLMTAGNSNDFNPRAPSNYPKQLHASLHATTIKVLPSVLCSKPFNRYLSLSRLKTNRKPTSFSWQ
jgi:hypothetical protein